MRGSCVVMLIRENTERNRSCLMDGTLINLSSD